MYLLIDDERDIHCDITARTIKAGKIILEKLFGEIETLGIDHDLGDPQGTGYNILVWALERGCLPNRIQIVTFNPVGREAMEKFLLRNGYIKENYSVYVKL